MKTEAIFGIYCRNGKNKVIVGSKKIAFLHIIAKMAIDTTIALHSF
jgi:hypothetical protein